MPATCRRRELESQAETLKKWRDKTVITYCDSGVSGAGAARTLIKLGFTKVFNLEAGLNAWVKDNLPLAKTAAGGKTSCQMSRPAITIYATGWCPYCSARRAADDAERTGIQGNQRG